MEVGRAITHDRVAFVMIFFSPDNCSVVITSPDNYFMMIISPNNYSMRMISQDNYLMGMIFSFFFLPHSGVGERLGKQTC